MPSSFTVPVRNVVPIPPEPGSLTVMIDNFDSFTYNIVQYLEELGATVRVFRHDAITVAELEALAPRRIVISPGPGAPRAGGDQGTEGLHRRDPGERSGAPAPGDDRPDEDERDEQEEREQLGVGPAHGSLRSQVAPSRSCPRKSSTAGTNASR